MELSRLRLPFRFAHLLLVFVEPAQERVGLLDGEQFPFPGADAEEVCRIAEPFQPTIGSWAFPVSSVSS